MHGALSGALRAVRLPQICRLAQPLSQLFHLFEIIIDTIPYCCSSPRYFGSCHGALTAAAHCCRAAGVAGARRLRGHDSQAPDHHPGGRDGVRQDHADRAVHLGGGLHADRQAGCLHAAPQVSICCARCMRSMSLMLPSLSRRIIMTCCAGHAAESLVGYAWKGPLTMLSRSCPHCLSMPVLQCCFFVGQA